MSARDYVLRRSWELGYPPEVITGPSRRRDHFKARSAIAKELRAKSLTLPEIGKALKRHHTTVMNLLGLFAPRSGPRRVINPTPRRYRLRGALARLGVGL